jgi:hypothetical protein
MRIFKILLASVVAVTLFSCEPTFKKVYSWAYPIAGDWMITAYTKSDGAQASNPFEMRAYNPSFGTDSIWIDDYATTSSNGRWYSFKFKVAANMSAKTFSAITSTNQLPSYHIDIVVENGKIVGNDSLYMEVAFGDDPTTTYILTGHREVGYDEYMGNY